MNRKKIIPIISVIAAAILLFTYAPALAGDDVQELKKQIEQLQKRVDELEAQKTYKEEDSSLGFFNRPRNQGWNPFEEMHRMQDEMDRMFQNSFSSMGSGKHGMFSSSMSFNSDLDMKETDQGYEITFDMTGLDKEKVDIEVNEHSITVKGEHSRQDTKEEPNRYFSSSSYGSFMKTIPLPVDADTTKVKTEKKGDRLVITLPKKVS